MKRSGIFLLGMMLMLSILAITLVSAQNIPNITLITPAQGGTVGGNYVLNATFNGTTSSNATCFFYAMSSSTANSSWSLLGSEINRTRTGSGGLDICNITVNLKNIIEDSNDYIFNVTVINNTNGGSVTNTGIIVDNTIPQAPTSLTPVNQNSLTTSGTQTFSSTVVNFNTTSCTYQISRGGATSGGDFFSGTATYSASTCSFTKAFTTTNDNGNWVWSITASDGTNTTRSTTNNLVVSLVGAGGGGNSQVVATGNSPSGTPSNGSNAPMIGIIAIVIIIVAIIIIKANK